LPAGDRSDKRQFVAFPLKSFIYSRSPETKGAESENGNDEHIDKSAEEGNSNHKVDSCKNKEQAGGKNNRLHGVEADKLVVFFG